MKLVAFLPGAMEAPGGFLAWACWQIGSYPEEKNASQRHLDECLFFKINRKKRLLFRGAFLVWIILSTVRGVTSPSMRYSNPCHPKTTMAPMIQTGAETLKAPFTCWIKLIFLSPHFKRLTIFRSLFYIFQHDYTIIGELWIVWCKLKRASYLEALLSLNESFIKGLKVFLFFFIV